MRDGCAHTKLPVVMENFTRHYNLDSFRNTKFSVPVSTGMVAGSSNHVTRSNNEFAAMLPFKVPETVQHQILQFPIHDGS